MSAAAPNDRVRLGLMPPLTGLVSLYGEEIVRAARLATEDVNARGGVLGRPLELVIEDDGSLPETAVPAAERLLDKHGCVALIGNLLSNSRIAVVGRVAEPRRVPLLNFSFYEGSINSRYFFHFAALPNQQIDRMIPYMARAYGGKMYFAGSNYEWPLGSIDAAKRALLDVEGEVVGEEYLPLGAFDFDLLLEELLERVALAGADVFVPYFAGVEQARLLTRFAERGLKRRMAVVRGHFDEAMASSLAPEVREDLYSSNTYFMSLLTAENRALLDRLAREPGVSGLWPMGNGVLTNFGEATYVCVCAFARAAEAAGALDGEALVAALERVSVTAPQGRMTMDAATHHAHVNSYLARCGRDGAFTIVERFGCIPPSLPERYRSARGTQPADAAPAEAPPSGMRAAAVVALDDAGRIVFVNHSLLRLWGHPAEHALIGQPVAVLWDEAHTEVLDKLLAAGGDWYGHLTARLASGEQRLLRVALEPLMGEAPGCVLTCTVSESGGLDHAQNILSLADTAVVACDPRGTIVQANRAAAEMFGYAPGELRGMSVHWLLPPRFRARHESHFQRFLAGPVAEIPMGRRGEIAGYRKDGAEFPLEASIAKYRGEDGWVLVATLRDISDRKEAQEQLLWRATHDALTQLPNRALIRDRLTSALARARRGAGGVALLFIDLDGFKPINDSHGHELGDRLLIDVARRLAAEVRPGDTVGRIGGDEFVVLCEQIGDPMAVSTLAERLNRCLRAPIHIDGLTLFVSASIGLALGDGHELSADELLRNADAAMYAVKQRGRDHWQFFSEDLRERVARRLTLTTDLRQAIERAELRVVCQAIVACDSGRVRGAELLLRWRHAGNDVSPADFIPIAEDSGLIVGIGDWVFRQACRLEKAWRDHLGADAPYVSVNVSTRQLGDVKLPARFAAALAEHDAQARRITIEVTETALMADVDTSSRVLDELAALGLRVAVDDFGTGYSSLALLLRLPVHALKIDRVFVDGLENRRESRTLTATLIGMARALGLEQIAEGVENAAQLAELRAMGCDYVQGFHLYRPMEEDAFLARMAAGTVIPGMGGVPLYFLLYVSSATHPMDRPQLDALLTQARAFNGAHGITGFLLYRDGLFMQMLEGTRDAVRALFERIRQDGRHRDVRVVVEGGLDQRVFPDWSMGYRDMEAEAANIDFSQWKRRTIDFLELSEDARACYAFITAFH